MSDPRNPTRERKGEQGFTLIELLVVVTIIGILAAIVSVSVGGFTGKASIQAHKSTANGVQAAVDAYIADHYSGTGAVVPPTAADTTIVAADEVKWYDTNGSVLGAGAGPSVYKLVSFAQLTQSTTTVVANTTRTQGPYLRLGGNATIACVFKDTLSGAGSGAGGTTASSPDGMYQILQCSDSAQTAQ